MRTSTLVVVVLLGAATIGAAHAALGQSSGNPNLERMTLDTYTRSHDYDLVHQRIALRDFDWDSLSFTGTVATTLVALRPAFDSVVLDAGHLLRMQRVVDDRGAALRHEQHGDTLVVHLARAASFGDTVRFTIDYGGKVDNGRGLTFIDARARTPKQIWSQGEDHDNHFWVPTYDFPNDKETWEVEATVPSGYTAVSNGSLVSDTRASGGARTMRWNQSLPSATYLMSLVVAPLAKIHDTWKGVPVDYYVYHQDSALAWPLFHVTPDMIDVYSRLTGVPYPWQKYAQSTVADFFGGMENVSATTLVDWLPDARAYQDRPWYQYILIPHELSHQWFGDYVTTENWANMWLNEGFAEFMPGQYWLAKKGPHAEQDYYADEYRQFMQIDARRRMPLASLGSNNIYPKGALVIEMLKHYLGEQRFWAGIHRYLTTHAFGNGISDQLREAFLQTTGENLDWFWNEWVYSAGYPDFTVQSSYDAAAHRLMLTVTQTQRDTLRADTTGMRYVVPEIFRMPVTVRVSTTAGDVSTTQWIRQRDDTVIVDGVNSAPTMVIFDDGNHVLKTLTFDEPTPWLAEQLKRDGDLWNRQWAIEQLSKRGSDGAAAAAVADAATAADYSLTRAQAASALGRFPAAVALPALQRAVHDTSSAVRSAALGGLGQLGGEQALAAARNAWQKDASYDVRAAALSALVRLDSANRRAVIAEGMRTPSYQDAIQNMAMTAAFRTGDTSFVDAVHAQMGDRQLPSFILAAYASRGNQHALDLLVSDLNDPRGYVRRWAVQALSGGMDPTRALQALRSADAGLKYADMRVAVAEAISRLQKR